MHHEGEITDDTLLSLIDTLTDREIYVLKKHYLEEMTLEEIAKTSDVFAQTLSRAHISGMEK